MIVDFVLIHSMNEFDESWNFDDHFELIWLSLYIIR